MEFVLQVDIPNMTEGISESTDPPLTFNLTGVHMSLLDKTWFGGGVEKFFGSQSFVRARIVDPLTSHMAAESVTNVAPVHMDVIYACLKRFGPLGKDGIAKQTGLTNSQIARRLPEMQKLGMIALTGKTVASNSGRQEREWIIL
jgi:hypothetical protein